MGMGPDSTGTALRVRPSPAAGVVPIGIPAVGAEVAVAAAPAALTTAIEDPDQPPASAPPKLPASPPPQVKQNDGQPAAKSGVENTKAEVKDSKAADEAAKGDHSASEASAQPGGNAASSTSPLPVDPEAAPASEDGGLKKMGDDKGEGNEETLLHIKDAEGDAGP